MTPAALAGGMDLAGSGRVARAAAAEPVPADRAAARLGGAGAVSTGVRQPLWVQLRDRSDGEALHAMGAAYGQSFAGVRLADDPGAHREAGAEQAVAFTRSGPTEQVSFGVGGYAPGTRAGAYTLAHELAHVVQFRHGADPDAGPGVRTTLERQADDAARNVLAGRAAGLALPGSAGRRDRAGPPAVLHQNHDHPETAGTATQPEPRPVVWTMGVDEAQRRALEILSAGPPRTPADQVGAFFFVGRTIRLYRGGVLRATVRLADEAPDTAAGIFRAGADGTAEQLYATPQPDGTSLTSWIAAGADDPLRRTMDQVVPTDRQAYLDIVDATQVRLWFRLQSSGGPGVGAGTGVETGPTSEGGGDGETDAPAAAPLPGWATALHAGLINRLNAEQRRIAELASTTIGDASPESLLRLFALEGVPQRLALGRLDQPGAADGGPPAEQVTVNRRAPGATRSTSASGTMALQQRDTVDVAWERVLAAARLLYLNRPDTARVDRSRDVAAEMPIGLPGTQPRDADEVPPNAGAFPAAIHNWGPALAVTGATHRFTMDLDWSIEGEWGWAAAFAARAYEWRLYKINDATGAEVDPSAAGNVRGVGPGEGAGLVWRRGFGDIWEDVQATTAADVADGGRLMAVDVAMRSIGTLVRSYVALVSQPSNERALEFTEPGTYVVLCASAQLPVHRTERIPNPVVRAPSVAVFPIRADTASHLAQTSVAPTEVTEAQTTLAEASADLEHATDADRERLARVVDAARAEVARRQATDELDLSGYLTQTIAERNADIASLTELIRQTEAGTPPERMSPDLRLLRAGLLIGHIEPAEALRQATAYRDQLVIQQRALGEVTGLSGRSYRPHVAFVPDVDGRVLPVTMLLAQADDSTATRQHWVLVDVSVAGHRDRYEGWHSGSGPAASAAAITAAFEDFAGTVPYGRGQIGVRLPESLQQELAGEAVPDHYRAHPDVSERTWQRLESLAAAAGIASLVVSGPVGVALGVVGGVAGGAVAIHHLQRRVAGGYFAWDLQTALDITAMIGAVLPGVGALAGRVRAGSRLVQLADWTEQGIQVFGYVQLGGMFVVVPLSLAQQIAAIKARTDLSPGEAAALQAEAFLAASSQMAQLAAGAAQMIGHAGEPRAPRRPALPEPVPEGRPPGSARTPSGDRETVPTEVAPGRPPEPPVPGAEPQSRGLVREPIEHGMVMMAPEGQTLSRRVAEDFFDSAARNTPDAEVALLRNADSGDFVIVIGDERQVRLGEGNPDWQEILPERARTGRWVLEAHSHAADPATGYTTAEARWPSGAEGDFLVVVNEAQRTGQRAAGRIRLRTSRGDQTTTYAYDPGAARPYEVSIALPDGRTYSQRYATIEDFYADRARRVGTPPEPVPDTFPGARRTPPAPPVEPPVAPGETARTQPDVPEAARSPQTAAPARTRQQELAAATAEAAEAAGTSRAAEANARLIDVQNRLTAGFEETGLSAGQLARMLDAGLSPDQVHALRTVLGERAGGYLDRAAASALGDLGQAAQRLAPLLDDPALAAGVARMRQPTASNELSPMTVLERLQGVPAERLPTLLRVIGDPMFPLWGTLTPASRFVALYENPQVLDLVARYGSTIWELLSRGSDTAVRRQTLVELARQVAEHPETADDLVNAVIEAGTPRAMADAVRIPRPPRQVRPRVSAEIAADPNLPGWATNVTQAETFARDHPDWLAEATAPSDAWPSGRPQADVVTELAGLYQVQLRARLGAYRQLSHAERLTLLRNFIDAVRGLGWIGSGRTTWANQASGALSEALFLPEGARTQINLPHPGGGGVSRIDYLMSADGAVISGVPNYVEQKSDELSLPGGRAVSAGDVAKCRLYVDHGVLDQPAILAAGGAHLIEFVRAPGNDATLIAMFDVLLGPASPYSAARIGGGDWITRAAWPAERAAILARQP